LRQFSLEIEVDPSYVSRIETGKVPPPDPDALEKFAKALGLAKGSEERNFFIELAKIDKSDIRPELQEILSDEEIVKKLPAFYRIAKKNADPEKQAREIIRLIKEGKL